MAILSGKSSQLFNEMMHHVGKFTKQTIKMAVGLETSYVATAKTVHVAESQEITFFFRYFSAFLPFSLYCFYSLELTVFQIDK